MNVKKKLKKIFIIIILKKLSKEGKPIWAEKSDITNNFWSFNLKPNFQEILKNNIERKALRKNVK